MEEEEDIEDLRKLASYLKRQGHKDEDIFCMLLGQFEGALYSWGNETTEKCDCSGNCCSALNALYGTHERYTADMLSRYFFTKEEIPGNEGIYALFFYDTRGRAIHVCARVKGDFYLNASSLESGRTARIRPIGEIKEMFSAYSFRIKKLDEKAWKARNVDPRI